MGLPVHGCEWLRGRRPNLDAERRVTVEGRDQGGIDGPRTGSSIDAEALVWWVNDQAPEHDAVEDTPEGGAISVT